MPIIFAMPGNEKLTSQLAERLEVPLGEAIIRRFPDGESYVRIMSDVKDKDVIVVCTLQRPDDKFLPLQFFSITAKDLGAKNVTLLAPYLAYMRQDKRFQEGESVTSRHFGALISHTVDALVTVDPHLHRRSDLSEVYDVPNVVLHAADHISDWIKAHVKKPVLIGPDSESEQWVSEVARNCDAPYFVLQKIRHGDKDVEVRLPSVVGFEDHTPVLVDDIISTARTMIEAVHQLKRAGLSPVTCVGVHAVFAGNAYKDLLEAGAREVVTTNTIPHESNGIDVSELLVEGLEKLKASK